MGHILCAIGLHKVDPYTYIKERRQRGRHKYHVNYSICQRCGKRLRRISFHRRKDK